MKEVYRALVGTRDGRSPWVARLAWVLVLAALGAFAGMAFGGHRGDIDGALRVANDEVEHLLEGNERILARAPVYQRIWWDYYRHTYGVLAATDRRLLFVGVPPEPLLHRERGPVEVVDASFPYTRGVSVGRQTGRRGRVQVRVVSGSLREEVGALRPDVPRVDAVLDSVSGRLAAIRAAADAERRAIEAAAAAARRPIWHLVRRGEALDAIARRYGTLADSLVSWNQLPGPRIVVGQRLLVRPGQDQ